jgi:hypothetical protein
VSIQGDSADVFPAQVSQTPGVVLDNIYQVSPLFLGDLSAYFTQNPFPIPIAQVTGFDQITPFVADAVQAEESKSGNTYGALATPGPVLTGLADGSYLVIWGCSSAISDSTSRAKMAVSINGAAADDANHCYTTTNPARSGAVKLVQYSLSAGSNTITCLYQASNSSGGSSTTGTWGGRFLAAIRVSGP